MKLFNEGVLIPELMFCLHLKNIKFFHFWFISHSKYVNYNALSHYSVFNFSSFEDSQLYHSHKKQKGNLKTQDRFTCLCWEPSYTRIHSSLPCIKISAHTKTGLLRLWTLIWPYYVCDLPAFFVSSVKKTLSKNLLKNIKHRMEDQTSKS